MQLSKRQLAVIIGGVSTVVGLAAGGIELWNAFHGESRFPGALLETRDRLYDFTASEEARVNAVRELQQLPRTPRQAQEVAEVLQDFLTAHARLAESSDPSSGHPCSQPSDSVQSVASGEVVPAYIGRALVALGTTIRQAETGGRIELGGANLEGVQVDSIWLEGAVLAGACLRDARLNGAGLAGADLTGAVLDGALLEGAELDSARLEDASLVGAGLNNARLVGTVLTRADLTRASLVRAQLTLSLLAEAKLDTADLSGADLAGAYLEGASLNGVLYWTEVRDFDMEYLSETEGLSDDLLRFAAERGAITTQITQRQWQEKRREFERRKRPTPNQESP